MLSLWVLARKKRTKRNKFKPQKSKSLKMPLPKPRRSLIITLLTTRRRQTVLSFSWRKLTQKFVRKTMRTSNFSPSFLRSSYKFQNLRRSSWLIWEDQGQDPGTLTGSNSGKGQRSSKWASRVTVSPRQGKGPTQPGAKLDLRDLGRWQSIWSNLFRVLKSLGTKRRDRSFSLLEISKATACPSKTSCSMRTP